jgi:hypothetical protein
MLARPIFGLGAGMGMGMVRFLPPVFGLGVGMGCVYFMSPPDFGLPLAARWTEYAMAKLCGFGFPAASSAFRFLRNADLLALFTNGILRPSLYIFKNNLAVTFKPAQSRVTLLA